MGDCQAPPSLPTVTLMPSCSLLASLVFAFTFPAAAEWGEAIPIILSLILIEGLLSVDNAIAIAAMANHLPEAQKQKALRWGIIGAYVFRGLAMAGAAYIIANPWLKMVGAAYLLYLMSAHFTQSSPNEESGAGVAKVATRSFWGTIASIELMDLSLSVDNVVAAVAMSPKLWVVCLGVFIGILALRFVAGYCLKLLEKYPILEHTAFLLIGYVGLILLVELIAKQQGQSIHINPFEKFIGIVLITSLSLVYARSAAFQRAIAPAQRILLWPLRAIALTFGGVLTLLVWPFKAVVNAVRANRTAA